MSLIPTSQRTGGSGLEGQGVARKPPPMSPRPLAAVGCYINGGWRGPGKVAEGAVLSSLVRRLLPWLLLPLPGVGAPQAGEYGPSCGSWHVWVN